MFVTARKKTPFLLLILFLLAAPMLYGGCAEQKTESGYSVPGGGIPSLDDDDVYLEATEAQQIIADPLEPWNRFWFSFNDVAYNYVLHPLNTGYTFIVPKPVRSGIGNFFHNLGAPLRMAHNLLQGKGMAAGVELSSFVLNTVGGLGGIFDIASSHKKVVEINDEDAGQTLGVWGIGEGFYIVWPLLGPSNARDSLGMGIDYFADPLTWVVDSWEVRLGISAINIFNSFDKLLDTYDTMKGMSVEPYSSLRDAYTQYRRAQVAK
ncbi:MAG: VacJ family lipoprotein [Deltaproteobacteria bacterium]|jgi:phospholipid-binding lipoprotein MlaA|nr:VacJ family lipoprotein [Deltaproteobacteria bacterium]